jgi:hypothetical protein
MKLSSSKSVATLHAERPSPFRPQKSSIDGMKRFEAKILDLISTIDMSKHPAVRPTCPSSRLRTAKGPQSWVEFTTLLAPIDLAAEPSQVMLRPSQNSRLPHSGILWLPPLLLPTISVQDSSDATSGPANWCRRRLLLARRSDQHNASVHGRRLSLPLEKKNRNNFQPNLGALDRPAPPVVTQLLLQRA